MSFNKNLIDSFVNITSKAATSCFKYLGKNDKKLADKAATDEMRKNLNLVDIAGKVVIGEGELDEAPMLYIGEKLGTGNGPRLDIAVDPLEGTNFAAKSHPGALSVMAVSKKVDLFHSLETYMKKIADSADVTSAAAGIACAFDK